MQCQKNFVMSPPLTLVQTTTVMLSLIPTQLAQSLFSTRSGKLVYDGNVDGIAAVIIAPGPAISRDDDNNGTYEYKQVRGTAAEQNNPINYLDTFNEFDNSNFLNAGNNDADGFILGPVIESDPNSTAHNTIIVNDQFILVTAAEVIEVAEKAVLGAYRDVINEYLAGTGNVYPWLYNYAGVPDVPGLSSYYPAVSTAGAADFATELNTNLDNIGRIPSIFTSYFTETTGQPIDTTLDIEVSLIYPLKPTPITSSASGIFEFNGECSGESPPLDPPTDSANCNSNGGSFDPTSVSFNLPSVDILTDVQFLNITDIGVAKNGLLTGTVNTSQPPFSETIYFWRDDGSTDPWTRCSDDGDNIPEDTDCNRNSTGKPKPGGTNETRSELLRVFVEFSLNAGTVNFETDYNFVPTIAVPMAATGTTHASITGTFGGSSIINSPLSVNYELDEHFHEGLETFNVDESGTLDFGDLNVLMALTMRYYPELPDWVFDNGWHNSIVMAYAY